MSDKYEMAVTINPLVCPLLHARLGQCATARERAAVLRALAEKLLRFELAGALPPEGFTMRAPTSPTVMREPSHTSDTGGSAATAAPPASTTRAVGPTEGIQALRLAETVDADQQVGEEIGSQLAGFLD